MTSKIINKHKVVVYDSIDEMPILNYQKYSKLAIIDSGIGGDMDSINMHITKIASLIAKNPNLAIQELTNMQQSLYYILFNVNPKLLSYMAFIAEIDGKKVNDLSDENLMLLLNKLNGEKVKFLVKIFETLKKKITDELETYFPSIAENAKVKELYDVVKRRANLLLDMMLTGNESYDELSALNDILVMNEKPNIFSGKKSIIIKVDKQFDTSCMLIAKYLNVQVKSLSIREYYSALETMNDKKFNN